MDKELEEIRKNIDKALKKTKELLDKNKYDINDKTLKEIPDKKGVYVFYSKNNKIYIGSATGKRGLHQRITNNHLRKSYTKSVFRKAVAKEYNKSELDGDVVNCIRKDFNLSYIEMDEDISFIKLTERLLIWGFKTNELYNKE